MWIQAAAWKKPSVNERATQNVPFSFKPVGRRVLAWASLGEIIGADENVIVEDVGQIIAATIVRLH